MKKLVLCLTSFVLSLSLAACNSDNNESSTTTNETTTAPSTSANVVITDINGDSIDLTKEYNTIISCAPSNTEILLGLGVKDKIIATDINSSNIEGIDSSIAYLDLAELNMEKIISLKPDLIVLNEINFAGDSSKYDELLKSGITIVNIDAATSIKDIMNDISVLAEVTDTQEKGIEMINSIKAAMDDVTSKCSNIKDKSKVYYEVSPSPYLYSTGSGTYIDEIISLAGGENIYKDQKSWLSNTDESVIEADPDVIITSVEYDGYDYNEIYSREGWNNIKAIKDKHVYQIDADAASRASQNIVTTIYQIAEAIHPECFED